MAQLSRPIRIAQVEAIAGLADPVLRNLLITLAYHDLSVQLQAFLPGSDLSWCGFATWASRSAGETIRATRLEARVCAALERSGPFLSGMHALDRLTPFLPTRFKLGQQIAHSHLLRGIRDAIQRVSDALASGNLQVFEELGKGFALLLEAFADQPNDPVMLLRGKDGLDAQVLAGFDEYARAASATAARERAEAVLRGNLLLVFREQARLDKYIHEAMSVPIGTILEGWLGRSRVVHLVWRGARRILWGTLAKVYKEIDDAWESALTRLLMELETADETLALDEDVPEPPGQGSLFPANLQQLSPATRQSLARFDRTGGTAANSGATNWTEIGQRMNYIANLFRSRQEHAPLQRAPFTLAQQAALERGQVPAEFGA